MTLPRIQCRRNSAWDPSALAITPHRTGVRHHVRVPKFGPRICPGSIFFTRNMFVGGNREHVDDVPRDPLQYFASSWVSAGFYATPCNILDIPLRDDYAAKAIYILCTPRWHLGWKEFVSLYDKFYFLMRCRFPPSHITTRLELPPPCCCKAMRSTPLRSTPPTLRSLIVPRARKHHRSELARGQLGVVSKEY